jgi:hypothetical protein
MRENRGFAGRTDFTHPTGTYRTMTEQHGLTPEQFERWLRSYYRNMLHS